MSSLFPIKEEINYRALYGKLFSGLLGQFGAGYVSEIEDAIQESFFKSLKIWSQAAAPKDMENWLFIVARNDILNQIKSRKTTTSYDLFDQYDSCLESDNKTDLRLQTIVLIASLTSISKQSKVLFILKNIFGLTISELSGSTLLHQEAIYKSIKRAKLNIQREIGEKPIDLESLIATHEEEIALIEEVLYSVFNIGFDSFNAKVKDIVNKDLCLEAIALATLLSKQQFTSTKNLLALFCFHAARIPAKVKKGKIVPFFHQDRRKWNGELLNLGFHYLTKSKELNRYYLEALIANRYMVIKRFTNSNWLEMVSLYELLQRITPSPIVKLNYCFCLSKVEKTAEALAILATIEKEMPASHIYLSLVKAKITKKINQKEADDLFNSVLSTLHQDVRRKHILENELIPL